MSDTESAPATDDTASVPGSSGWVPVSSQLMLVELLATAAVVIVSGSGALVLWWVEFLWAAFPVGAFAALSLLSACLIPRRVRAIGYQLRVDDLLFRRGVLVQRVVAVPYGRMQLVDINRGPMARLLGLAELKLVTAAAATAVVIPGLTQNHALELRDRLVELAETRRAGL